VIFPRFSFNFDYRRLRVGSTNAMNWRRDCSSILFGNGLDPASACERVQPCYSVFNQLCEPGVIPPTPEFVLPTPQGTVVQVSGAISSADGSPAFVRHGVFSVGTPIQTRLGILNTATFDPDANGNVSGAASFDGPFWAAGQSTANIRSWSSSFRFHDPDLTSDGVVNWADREEAVRSLGLDVNSFGYNARADWNLDGTINSNDLASYVLVWDQIACNCDFNRDGACNTTDLFAFMTAFFGQDQLADYNLSGVVDTQDLFAFLSVALGQTC